MVVLVICVTENGSIGRWRVRVHLGAKNFSFHLDKMTSSRHMVSLYKVQNNVFIVMISNCSLKTVIRHIPLWIIEALLALDENTQVILRYPYVFW